jgi:hypothetical protein
MYLHLFVMLHCQQMSKMFGSTGAWARSRSRNAVNGYCSTGLRTRNQTA